MLVLEVTQGGTGSSTVGTTGTCTICWLHCRYYWCSHNCPEEVDLLIIDLSVHFLVVALIIPGVGILLIIVLVIIEGCQAQSGKSQQGESGPDDHGGSAQVGQKLQVRLVNPQRSLAYL